MSPQQQKPDKLSRSSLETTFLEPSPYKSDGVNLIGKNPLFLSKEDLKLLDPPPTPLKAIRAWCIECGGDSPSEARKCPAMRCPLWPYRMGKNPLDPRTRTKSLNEKALAATNETKANETPFSKKGSENGYPKS